MNKLGSLFSCLKTIHVSVGQALRYTLLLAFACATVVTTGSTMAHADEAQDAYDPFIDYNEYESADEEEADINFFQNGRMLTMGFLLGQRSFTEGMGEIFNDDAVFGMYLSYFFDLRFALQFGYLTGSHGVKVTGGPTTVTGDSDMSAVSVHFKYYVNTQNVTKGLATLNPYFIAGFSNTSRETVIDGQPEFGKDSAMGFDAGAGIEFPMLRNKMYFGAQAMYSMVNFKDENTEIKLNNSADPTGKYPNGDMFTILGIIGVNF